MKWNKYFNRPFSLQKDEFSVSAYLADNPFYCFTRQFFIPQGKTKGDFYFLEQEWQKFTFAMAKYARSRKNFLNHHLRMYRRYKSELLRAAGRLGGRDISKVSPKDALRRYHEYRRVLLRFGLFFFFPMAINEHVDPLLYRRLKRLHPRDYEKMHQAIAAPTKEVAINRQYREMLEYARAGKLKQKVPKHVKEYCYLSVYDVNDPAWAEKDFLKQIRGVKAGQELRNYHKALQKARKDYRWALNKIRDPETKLLATLVHEYAYLRTERIEAWHKAMYCIKPFYAYLEQEMRLPRGAAAHLKTAEIEHFLERGEYPDRSELRQRLKNRYILKLVGRKAFVISRKSEMSQIIKRVLKIKINDSVKLFNGQVAYPGKVTGRAVLLFTPPDCRKVKKGDIIVASMTHPDYLSALRKAAAFVTDEGGITCHAAVISRELKTPCVIGTKIATKVLKDGDRVEVDATNGVVRKL